MARNGVHVFDAFEDVEAHDTNVGWRFETLHARRQSRRRAES